MASSNCSPYLGLFKVLCAAVGQKDLQFLADYLNLQFESLTLEMSNEQQVLNLVMSMSEEENADLGLVVEEENLDEVSHNLGIDLADINIEDNEENEGDISSQSSENTPKKWVRCSKGRQKIEKSEWASCMGAIVTYLQLDITPLDLSVHDQRIFRLQVAEKYSIREDGALMMLRPNKGKEFSEYSIFYLHQSFVGVPLALCTENVSFDGVPWSSMHFYLLMAYHLLCLPRIYLLMAYY